MAVVTLVGLVLALCGVHAVGRVVDPILSDGSDRAELLSSDLTKLLVSAMLVGFVLLVESRPLGSVGVVIPEFPRFFLLVVGGLSLMLLTSIVTEPVFDELGIGGVEGGLSKLLGLPRLHRLRVAVVAGVTEELLYRGYLIERLLELTDSVLVAGAVSIGLFGLVHYGFWDRDAAIRITVQGIPLVVLYVWTRSLPLLVVVHALHDFVGMEIAAATE
jgi:membrane protease YdiL (CAAX protease family)